MTKKILKLFANFAFCCIALSLNAQVAIKELSVGEIVPDKEISNIINFPAPSARISDFKGKLLILDFWATWCQPCVAAMPKLDSLQKEFGNKIQILPVTSEDKTAADAFLQKLSKVKHILPPSVTGDKVLKRLFKHNYLPHCVWINGDGAIIAITEGKEVTREHIASILEGKSVEMALKKDIPNSVVVNAKGTVFMPGINVNDGNIVKYTSLKDSNLVIHNVLTNYIEGLTSGTQGDALSVQAFNVAIVWLYRVALWKNGLNTLQPSKTIVEIQDSGIYSKITSESRDGVHHLSGLEYLSWIQQNGYSYEIKVPEILKDQKCDIMLTDLNRYFGSLYGIEGVIEKRKAKCLALIRTTKEDKLASKGGKPNFEINKLYVKLQNCMLNVLIYQLATPLQLHPPIIDETGYTGRVNLELNCDITDLKALNKELEKYGLQLKEKEMLQDIGVIRFKKKDLAAK